MSTFIPMNSLEQITLNSNWVDSLQFESKDSIVDEQGNNVGADYQGRTYKLIAQKERQYNIIERVGRILLGVLCVIGTCGLALKRSERIQRLFSETKETKLFGIKLIDLEEVKNGINEDYSIECACGTINQLAVQLQSQRKKLCLFIGRTPGEPFPGFGQKKPEDEVWVSLDIAKNSERNEDFVPGKQLHLRMDAENVHKSIQKLFDEVIVDVSVMKFFKDQWAAPGRLGNLLKPGQESRLILPTQDRPGGGTLLIDLVPFLPAELRDTEIEKFPTRESFLKEVDTHLREVSKKNRKFSEKKMLYECTLSFDKVQYETERDFPFSYRDEWRRQHFAIMSMPVNIEWLSPEAV